MIVIDYTIETSGTNNLNTSRYSIKSSPRLSNVASGCSFNGSACPRCRSLTVSGSKLTCLQMATRRLDTVSSEVGSFREMTLPLWVSWTITRTLDCEGLSSYSNVSFSSIKAWSFVTDNRKEWRDLSRTWGRTLRYVDHALGHKVAKWQMDDVWLPFLSLLWLSWLAISELFARLLFRLQLLNFARAT